MTTNTDPVRALIAKWQAAPYGKGDHDYYVDALRACARELESALAQQPVAGEEIMVNAAHGVYTLPLHPSGLLRGPRFVVHVPAPEQQPAGRVHDLAARLVDELDGLVGESDGVFGLHLNGDVAAWDELLPGGRFERLSSLDELRAALARVQGGRAALAKEDE